MQHWCSFCVATQCKLNIKFCCCESCVKQRHSKCRIWLQSDQKCSANESERKQYTERRHTQPAVVFDCQKYNWNVRKCRLINYASHLLSQSLGVGQSLNRLAAWAAWASACKAILWNFISVRIVWQFSYRLHTIRLQQWNFTAKFTYLQAEQ